MNKYMQEAKAIKETIDKIPTLEKDVEANAEAIEELASIVAGGE